MGRGPILWRFARAETPLLPATWQRRPRACAFVRSRQLPSVGASGIHWPLGQDTAPCDFSAAGSSSRVMYPCPWRAVGSAKIPAPQSPGAQVSCRYAARRPALSMHALRWSSQRLRICASGDAHGSHFRSPMSRPMRPPTPEESERQRGWRCGGQGSGLRRLVRPRRGRDDSSA